MASKVAISHLHVLGAPHHALLLCLHIRDHLLDPQVSCPTTGISQRMWVLLSCLLLLLQHDLLLLFLLQLLLDKRVTSR